MTGGFHNCCIRHYNLRKYPGSCILLKSFTKFLEDFNLFVHNLKQTNEHALHKCLTSRYLKTIAIYSQHLSERKWDGHFETIKIFSLNKLFAIQT